jgi:hypothetical protein
MALAWSGPRETDKPGREEGHRSTEPKSPLDGVPVLFYSPSMDWARAIEINRAALARIVAALVSLLAAQGEGPRLPLPVYQMIARVLYPAESAVRRLIVMAARGLDLPSPRLRPMPKGLAIERKTQGRVSFQLFDTRKHFGDPDDAPILISGPRIRSVEAPSPRELFLAQFAKQSHGPSDGFSSAAETQRVRRRLGVLKSALDHLPRQAKRMARWMKRRAMMKNPSFTSPLRPGPPPGRRSRSRDEIDLVLSECHALAWQALRPDTS